MGVLLKFEIVVGGVFLKRKLECPCPPQLFSLKESSNKKAYYSQILNHSITSQTVENIKTDYIQSITTGI